ncbi:MAG: UDP-N-acetylmuramoyl-tripeptide--D-alanyl-D-alanine ligase [Lewinellaceae bacterium]|nr:UDP-N-acetylmuramoyl-tripeptide--D-alanyl-D-alanine ligase [Saprospiraceae bacterium]MCB9314666.1 UDP-N-acetylmuramoyl-tripeptide--D-alanyl-D-alanine ligase [Lewinellaceae bacterium]MCB9334209.1 UDP-N-acetylmuramoyl-tripeptide--D-alanyl-D-alanine ligase [Lewinellaceae bacterium]
MITLDYLYSIYKQHPVVCTDTRQLTAGCVFFALKGENFDGNQFAAQALTEGAAYAIIDDPAIQYDSKQYLLVADVLESLQQLAAHHRRQFDIPVIAIGGSNGKTTTKELVAAVLSSHYPCHATTGNLNNHIGVPLTLLAMPAETEVAVIEMGTNQPGDIAFLCEIAAPTHGLLTNIGKEHLEGFGSLAGVKKAEGELFQYLAKKDGCVFVNTAERYLSAMSGKNRKRVFYAEKETLSPQESVIDIRLLEANPYLRLAFLSEHNMPVEVRSQLIGRHNFQNIMTAVALGVYFKVPAAKIKSAIESYVPANNRSQLLRQNGNTILLDAYNANPSSMRVALETLQTVKASQKIAVLGDMLELGAASLTEHQAILRLAARCKFDRLVVVGPEFGRCAPEKFKALHFSDTSAAKTWFETQKFDDAFILLKASRGIKLERVLG